MTESVKTSSDSTKQATANDTVFKGYTLEELRYQRALISLKKDFSQTKLLRNLDNVKRANPFSAQRAASSLPGRYGIIASKLFSGLSYLDYAMLGFSVFNSARKVYSFFHKKKR